MSFLVCVVSECNSSLPFSSTGKSKNMKRSQKNHFAIRNSTFHKVRIQKKDYQSLGYRLLAYPIISIIILWSDKEWYRDFIFKLALLIILKRIAGERLNLFSHYLEIRFLSVPQPKQNQIYSLISWKLTKKECLCSQQCNWQRNPFC